MVNFASPSPILLPLRSSTLPILKSGTSSAILPDSSPSLQQINSTMYRSVPVLPSAITPPSPQRAFLPLPTPPPTTPASSAPNSSAPTTQLKIDHLPLKYRFEYQRFQSALLKTRKTANSVGMQDPIIYCDLQKQKMSTSLDKEYIVYKSIDSRIKQSFTPLICSLVKKKLASIDYFESKANKYEGNLNIASRKSQRSNSTSSNINNSCLIRPENTTITTVRNRLGCQPRIIPMTVPVTTTTTSLQIIPTNNNLTCSVNSEMESNNSNNMVNHINFTSMTASTLQDIPEDLSTPINHQARLTPKDQVKVKQCCSPIQYNAHIQSVGEAQLLASSIKTQSSENNVRFNSCPDVSPSHRMQTELNSCPSPKTVSHKYRHEGSTDDLRKGSSLSIKRVTFSERTYSQDQEQQSATTATKPDPSFLTPCRRSKQSVTHHQFIQKQLLTAFDSISSSYETTATSSQNNSASPPPSAEQSSSQKKEQQTKDHLSIPRSLLMQAFPTRKLPSTIINNHHNSNNYNSTERKMFTNTNNNIVIGLNTLNKIGVNLPAGPRTLASSSLHSPPSHINSNLIANNKPNQSITNTRFTTTATTSSSDNIHQIINAIEKKTSFSKRYFASPFHPNKPKTSSLAFRNDLLTNSFEMKDQMKGRWASMRESIRGCRSSSNIKCRTSSLENYNYLCIQASRKSTDEIQKYQ